MFFPQQKHEGGGGGGGGDCFSKVSQALSDGDLVIFQGNWCQKGQKVKLVMRLQKVRACDFLCCMFVCFYWVHHLCLVPCVTLLL